MKIGYKKVGKYEKVHKIQYKNWIELWKEKFEMEWGNDRVEGNEEQNTKCEKYRKRSET